MRFFLLPPLADTAVALRCCAPARCVVPPCSVLSASGRRLHCQPLSPSGRSLGASRAAPSVIPAKAGTSFPLKRCASRISSGCGTAPLVKRPCWVARPRSLVGALKRIGFSHRLQPATSTHNPTWCQSSGGSPRNKAPPPPLPRSSVRGHLWSGSGSRARRGARLRGEVSTFVLSSLFCPIEFGSGLKAVFPLHFFLPAHASTHLTAPPATLYRKTLPTGRVFLDFLKIRRIVQNAAYRRTASSCRPKQSWHRRHQQL